MLLRQAINYNYINCQSLLQHTKNVHKKIFNKLPKYIAESLLRKKCFISNLKKYTNDKAFYSIEEHMNSQYSM